MPERDQRGGDVRVFGGEHPSLDIQRLLVPLLGLFELALGGEVDRQVVVALGDSPVVVGERLATDLKCSQEVRVGQIVFLLGMEVVRKFV